MPTIKLHVQSEIHEDDEYGARVNQNGKHSGGPFVIQVSPKMTVEDLRLEIKVSPPLILSLYLSISAKAGSLNYITRALPSPQIYLRFFRASETRLSLGLLSRPSQRASRRRALPRYW